MKSRISLIVPALAAAFTISYVHAAPINWGSATNLTGASDVFNVGQTLYSYTESNQAATVNGVSFTAGSSDTSLGGGNVTLTGFVTTNNSAYNDGKFSGQYANLMQGAAFGSGAGSGTVTMNNLTSGHVYATQFWVADYRQYTNPRTETLDGSVTLSYLTGDGSTPASGKGQYAIGGFTANATSQAINISSNESTQMNAIQVRDVTGVWSGAASGNWTDAASNFTGANSWTTASGLVNTVYFADTDGFKNAITNNTVAIQSGGVSTGNINFQNNSVNYTIQNSGANGITGSTTLSKTGSGTVTLTGANSYNGGTTVNAGTLNLSNQNALQNSTMTMNGGATVFDKSVIGNAFTIGGLVASSAGSGYDIALQNNDTSPAGIALTTGGNNAGTTYSGVLSGSGSLTKIGSGNLTLTSVNTYTGGTTVNAGTLELSGSTGGTGRIRGVLTVNSGGTVNVTGGDGTGFGYNVGQGLSTLNIVGGTVTGTGNNHLLDTTVNMTGGTLALSGGSYQMLFSPLNSLASASTATVSGNLRIRSDFGGNPLNITVADGAAATDMLISGNIDESSGGGVLNKSGAGTLVFSGTGSYTGATAVNAGTLKVTGSIANSTVTVNNAGTVLASGTTGTIGKGVTVNSGAILAAGGKNTIGTATVGSDGLDFASGSIFEWDLATSKDANGSGVDGVGGTDFDSLSVVGNLTAATTGAIFKVIFGASALADITDSGNAFWNTPYGTQTWNMSAIFGKNFTTNAFSSVATSNNVSTYGSFTVNGSSLTWTAVPEPTSALAGLLLTAGLLRRRRA